MLTAITSDRGFVDHDFDALPGELCKTCKYNGDKTGVPIDYNIICAHCTECNFIRTNKYELDPGEEDK